ncbi:MAG: hypothetical protein ABWZ52_06310 [Acidimicrobiales bacterium]
MPYVMVPVPEEHVEDVMQFILRAIARAALEPWTPESVTSIFEEVDEATRSLIAFVARASLEGKDLPDADAARQLQLTVRETMGIMNDLASTIRSVNRPALISTRGVSERLPNGRMTERRVFVMDLEVAEMVTEAERAELAASPHPLGADAR